MSSASQAKPHPLASRVPLHPPKGIPKLDPDQIRDPESARRTLDSYRPLFELRLPLSALVLPGKKLAKLTKDPRILAHVFSAQGYRHIQPHRSGDPNLRSLVLNIESSSAKREVVEGGDSGDLVLPSAISEVLKEDPEIRLEDHEVKIDYSSFSGDQILSTILPDRLQEKEGVPSGFTIVGHIAHLNLIEEWLPYRYVVGQVILEKNGTNIQTVVNKLDSIDTQFRFFKMELLAGKPDYQARVSESDCNFSFDFRTVYWNSRLHSEHARLVRTFRPYQVVSDVMAGVGPFALPACKKGVWVLANDLNPKSYESLLENARSNHVLMREEKGPQGDGGMLAFCEDGREFIRKSLVRAWECDFKGRPIGFGMGERGDERVREFGRKSMKQRQRERREAHKKKLEPQQQDLVEGQAPNQHASSPSEKEGKEEKERRHERRRMVDHFVMNLPASALEFLDAFRGCYLPLCEKYGKETVMREIERRQTLREEILRRGEEGPMNQEELDDSQEPYPMVHVHCFSKDAHRPGEDICRRANKALGIEPGSNLELVSEPILPPPSSTASRKSNGLRGSDELRIQLEKERSSTSAEGQEESQEGRRRWTEDLKVHFVRDVAPNKQMYCLSFRLNRQICFDEV
ncbi:hypothetical protein IE53DRAFT_346873 [Violaceomyces palustris]|uniref:Uncharacterized protein n=1 Tax=Violaceomyces palustris TaxID=1673888 RepID=A0ACD0NSP0_9BASI|nr:hypothetical protein IE53DRAFT_346873 [Violaceomyces palustris]